MCVAAIADSLGRHSGAPGGVRVGSEPDNRSPGWDGSDILQSSKDRIGQGQKFGLICPASLALDKTKPDTPLSPSVNPFSASAGRPDAHPGTVHPLWAVLLV